MLFQFAVARTRPTVPVARRARPSRRTIRIDSEYEARTSSGSHRELIGRYRVERVVARTNRVVSDGAHANSFMALSPSQVDLVAAITWRVAEGVGCASSDAD
jgi:hypothetical protein